MFSSDRQDPIAANRREPAAARRHVWAACRPTLLAVGLFSFFANLLMLTVPLYMLQLFDRVLTSRSRETLIMLTVGAAGALIVLGLIEAVRSRILVRISVWLERTMSPAILSRAVEAAASGGRTGRVQGLRDLSTLRGFLTGPGIFHLFDAPWVPLYIAVIFLLHPWLGWIALAGAILLFLMALLSEAVTRKPVNAAGARHVRMLGRADSHAGNAEAIEAMGMLPALVAEWAAEGAETVRLHQKASDRAGLLAATTKVLRLALQIAILAVGVHLAIAREITPGAMIAASIVLSRALAPVEQMIGTWKSFVAARTANRRIAQALAPPATGRGTTRLPVPEGRIDVEHATVIPPGGVTPVLQRIHFGLLPGE
ncbi:MAG TPA: ABC transporter transmembrane domain-containing protein, partial [Alphaproteobacteria bacterium]|nr:ABC transporter transmembrane domain-containing protein [Alphaproteobacteria bacterium]